MTVAAISALVGGSLCLFAAVIAQLLVGGIPEWRDEIGRFRWIALTAGAAVLCNVPLTVHELSSASAVWAGRLQFLFLCLHAAAWYHDLDGRMSRPRGSLVLRKEKIPGFDLRNQHHELRI